MTKRRPDAIKSSDMKIRRIFRRIAGKRIKNLDGTRFPYQVAKVIESAFGKDIRATKKRHDFAFHMVDWNRDAASMVALLLFPERFTKKEVWSLVYGAAIHAPNHMAAAAKLIGEPVADVFGVGALDNHSCRRVMHKGSRSKRVHPGKK